MSRGSGLGLVALSAALIVVLLVSMGAMKLNLPGLVPDITDHETAVYTPEVPEIVVIEPIGLDCRARVVAEIPVTGRKEHKLLGQVYRTDTVDMLAVADVDTCVTAGSTVVIDREDGTKEVLVPADAIVFHRPRVDAEATRGSVRFDKGFVGKLTDTFPWVSDNEGLTPAAYAFAQQVVGSSECMSVAYEITRELLVDAYAHEARDAGYDGELDVRIIGTPNFAQNDPVQPDSDFELRVDSAGAACRISGAVEVPAEVLRDSGQA